MFISTGLIVVELVGWLGSNQVPEPHAHTGVSLCGACDRVEPFRDTGAPDRVIRTIPAYVAKICIGT